MKQDNNKLITFVVPAYNVADYIEQCLNSILNQTDKDFKIIIVDDGSTDRRTPEICKSYFIKYPEVIKFISQKNKGLGGARNTGLEYVDTEYVMFLDSDDWLDINFIKNFKQEMSKINTEVVDIVFTMPTIHDNLSYEKIKWYDKDLFSEIFSNNKICIPTENKNIFKLEANVCRRVFRSKFIKDIEFKFDEHVKYEDVYPHFYLLSKSKKCAGIDVTSFYYRINRPNQITSLQNESRLDVVKVFAKSLDYLITSKADDEVIYCALDMLIDFSLWCINNSNIEIRKKLVESLSYLYKTIPKSIWKEYNKIRKNKRDKLFVKAMKFKILRRAFYDYSTVKIGYRLIWRGVK